MAGWPAMDDTELTAQVRELYNEPTALTVTDTEIAEWCDLAAQELSNLGNAYQYDSDYITLVAAQTKYAAPTQNGIVAVLYIAGAAAAIATPGNGGYALTKMHPRQFFHLQDDTAGAPVYWTYFKDYIYVWPKPTTTIGNASFICQLLTYKPLEDTPTTLITAWQHLPIYYALAKCFEKDGKPAQYNHYMSVFHNIVSFLRQAIESYQTPDGSEEMQLADYTQFN